MGPPAQDGREASAGRGQEPVPHKRATPPPKGAGREHKTKKERALSGFTF
nr:hypothetical protein HAGR004_33190 [Bdellovibrio sp. HAGR004]